MKNAQTKTFAISRLFPSKIHNNYHIIEVQMVFLALFLYQILEFLEALNILLWQLIKCLPFFRKLKEFSKKLFKENYANFGRKHFLFSLFDMNKGFVSIKSQFLNVEVYIVYILRAKPVWIREYSLFNLLQQMWNYVHVFPMKKHFKKSFAVIYKDNFLC